MKKTILALWQSNMIRTGMLIVLATLAAGLPSGCQSVAISSLPISKDDHTTQLYGDNTNYGPRQHYVHVVRDRLGRLKEVYRYYLDPRGRPVLDGPRDIYRLEQNPHDPGHRQLYHDGRLIREGDLDFQT